MRRRSDANRFYPVSCARPVREQRFIRAKLDLWNKLPEAEKAEIRGLIDRISQGSVERVALTAVLLRGVSPRTAAEQYRLNKGRVYQMQREFLEKVDLWH